MCASLSLSLFLSPDLDPGGMGAYNLRSGPLKAKCASMVLRCASSALYSAPSLGGGGEEPSPVQHKCTSANYSV